jgi:hemoglobin/transferrin/lactoferrin receptor protein
MRVFLAATTSVIALWGAGAAQAQERSAGEAAVEVAAVVVDPLTVIGTRTEKRQSETPATVSVISADDISETLAADIKDLVRYEPGVSVRSSPARFGAALGTTGRDGNAGFNIRGLEGNRVLIQVDGVRLPDAFAFGAQSVGRGDYLDLDLIKVVEILRGPASALYGSDGVAGAVSFTTKDPEDILAEGAAYGGSARGAYASADESWTGGLVAAGRSGRWSGMVGYAYREGHEQETQGEVATANTDRTVANPQDWASTTALAKVVFDASDAHRFRLTYEHFDRDIEADVLSGVAKPPLAATSVLRLLAKDTTDRDRFSVDYRYDGGGEGWLAGAEANLYWQDSSTTQFSAEDRNTAADRTRLNTFDNRVVGGAFEGESRVAFAGLDHRLVWGADVSRTRQTGIRSGTVPPAGETFPARAFPNTDYTLAGAFVQDELSFFDARLTLYPALRYDAYDLDPEADAILGAFTPAGQSDGRLSPKFGAVLKLGDVFGVFANYAQGFKAPSPSQVNNAFFNPIQNYRSIPNPDLKPETSETLEAGLRWTGTAWSASATGFAGEYDDFIEQIQRSGAFTPTDPGVFQFVNLGRVKIHGFEVKARASFENGFGAIVAASYAHGTAVNGGTKAPLDSVDPIKVVAGVTYRDPEGRFGGQLMATHSQGKQASDVAQVCTGGCFLPPGFTVLDLTAFWNITPNVVVNAGVFNLTDEKYWWWNDVRGLSATAVSRDAYTQPGRNLSVSLTFKL